MDEAAAMRELIRQAHAGDPEALGRLLEAHRDHLRSLAARQLRGRVAARVDASDIVQQTFLDAHRYFRQFLGEDEPQLVAWLERILDQSVAKTIRDHTLLQKRDVRREQALDAGGTSPPEPAAGHTPPSRRVMRQEDAERLACLLATLPEDQSEAVRLRHLEGWSLTEIARHLGKTPSAAAGLIKRGMQTLRDKLRPAD
jgi:RNA polymerase sigma-70 factor, ECF subfamily